MSCQAIYNILKQETGRFEAEIRKRVFAVSPWMRLTPRGVFPRGMGLILSNLTYERKAPLTGGAGWTALTIPDGVEGGSCNPAATKISVGQTERSYQPYQTAIEGPDFCINDGTFTFSLRDQLDAIMDALVEYVRIEWEDRDRLDYFTNCKRKVVCAATLVESNTMASSYPASEATSLITQGMLDTYYLKLLRDGASQDALGFQDGAPIFNLVCSHETSRSLISANDDIRDDFHWGDAKELLKPLGVRRTYSGWFHTIDPYPRRFSYAGGVYTQIPTFVNSNATKGTKSDINPDWEDPTVATHEESFAHSRGVYQQLVVEPPSEQSARVKFNPQDYTGHWNLLNIIDRTCNPLGNQVFHRADLVAAAKPKHPERGIAFIHKRCNPAINAITACE